MIVEGQENYGITCLSYSGWNIDHNNQRDKFHLGLEIETRGVNIIQAKEEDPNQEDMLSHLMQEGVS